jgi:hypothetical protein
MVFMVVGLSACSTIEFTILDSETYTPPSPERHLQALENSDRAPHPSELAGSAMKIIWNIESDVRDQLTLTENLKEDLAHYLKAEGIQIKDPKDKKTQHLIEEIERARRNASPLSLSGDNSIGEQKVHYYIKGSLTKSSLELEYSSPLWCPFCKEKRPGSCEYELESGLQIEVLSLPALQRVKHFSVKSEESYSVDVFNKCARYSTTAESANGYQDSRSDIIEDLVDCSGESLENFLSPQAYVEKYFSDGEKHVYQISSGSAAGIKKGDDLAVLRKNSVGVVKLGEAIVIAVQPYKAFMAVSDQKLLEAIRLHDKVKVEYTDYTLGLACMSAVTEH